MNREDFPAPTKGFVITHFFTVADIERARDFYVNIFDGQVVLENPAIVKIANTWLVFNVGGGPTEDKPQVTLAPPTADGPVHSFLNIRVADIHASVAAWREKGAEFLTPPVDYGREIRCYMRDPDGYIIEIGQATRMENQSKAT